MNRLLALILLAVTCHYSNGQDSCNAKANTISKAYYTFDKLVERDTFFYSNKIFYIRLMEYFNDTVKVFANDLQLLMG